MSFVENKKKVTETGILVLIGITMFLVFFRMLYYQALGIFPSDLETHIELAVTGRGYSFLYSIMGALLNIFDSVISIAAMGSVIVVGTWLATAKLVSLMLKEIGYFKSALVALPLLILTGIFIPIIYPYLYKQQLITQPYHNITYFGMRLFAVVSMLIFYKMFDNYLNKINIFYWVAILVTLAASTSVKPSFLYGFALCLLIFLIIDFFKSGFKAKPFGHIIIMGLVVIPSLLIMLSQYNILYAGKTSGTQEASGIALVWGANFIKKGFLSTTLKLICGIGFPCVVGFVNRKEFSRFDKFCYGLFFIEFAIAIIFVETGRRASHGNFFWGVYIGAYFMFLVAVTHFVRNIIKRRNEGKLFSPYPIIGGVMLTGHVLSSLLYLALIMMGKHFVH